MQDGLCERWPVLVEVWDGRLAAISSMSSAKFGFDVKEGEGGGPWTRA